MYTIGHISLLSGDIMRRLAYVLIFILILNSIPFTITANAMSKADVLKEKMAASAVLLQRAIDTSKDQELKSFKSGIATNGFDYELTMQSYGNQTDPYANADFTELIIAYATLKEKGYTDRALYNLPFIRINTIPKKMEATEPEKVETYEETQAGIYQVSGFRYIEEETEVPIYEKTGEDTYIKTERTRIISPKKLSVNYEEVEIVGLSADDIFAYFGHGNDNNLKAEYEKKLAQFKYIISGRGLGQMVSFRLPEELTLSEAITRYVEELKANEDLDKERKSIVTIALSLLGKVPYEWGGKATKKGYDFNWWTFDGYGRQKGLDCSGFVQWCFMTAGFMQNTAILQSTQTILENTTTIGFDEIEPGDIGLLNNGSSINHTGIYLGNGYWIHCSSGAGTVTIEQTDMFTIFKRMPTDELTGEEREAFLENYEAPLVEIPQLIYKDQLASTGSEETTGEVQPSPAYEEEQLPSQDEYVQEEATIPEEAPIQEEENKESEYSLLAGLFTEEDVYLLAQLVYHEAHIEGLNGWIAVAEVVKNRVLSKDFPGTIREVIFQEGQFAILLVENRNLQEEVEVVKQVLAGKIMVLGNENVLYFRNAKGKKDDWGPFKWFTEINHHEFYLGKET